MDVVLKKNVVKKVTAASPEKYVSAKIVKPLKWRMDAATLIVAVLANSAVNQVIVANQEKSVNAKIVDPSNLNHALAWIKIAAKMTDAVKN